MKHSKNEITCMGILTVGIVIGFGLGCYFNLFTLIDRWWDLKNAGVKLDVFIFVLLFVNLFILIKQRKEGNGYGENIPKRRKRVPKIMARLSR